jgi:hypothetical protein
MFEASAVVQELFARDKAVQKGHVSFPSAAAVLKQ